MGFRVRLHDGSEVPLDGEMLRSWYEEGLIDQDTPVLGPGSSRWIRLGVAVDLSGWRQTRAAARHARRGPAGVDSTIPAQAPRWRSRVAAALFLVGAAGAGLVMLFPATWRLGLAAPWREIGLVQLLLALCLGAGWDLGRKIARVVVVLLALAVFPVAGYLFAQGTRGAPLIVLALVCVVASGVFALLSPGLDTLRTVLSLLLLASAVAGIVYVGFLRAPAPPASSTLGGPGH